MKRLWILTTLAAMTAGLTGCRCCDWLWRGASATPAAVPATSVMMADPCNPCDPCSTVAPACGACSPAVPAPGGYMGAPGS
ncbi:MAG: hypothetical protein JW809_05320 [Pirellulales bacterium]|nr:hypothetical protein [Pirellulales bacterium]